MGGDDNVRSVDAVPHILVVGDSDARAKCHGVLKNAGYAHIESTTLFEPSRDHLPDVIIVADAQTKLIEEMQSVSVLEPVSVVMAVHGREDLMFGQREESYLFVSLESSVAQLRYVIDRAVDFTRERLRRVRLESQRVTLLQIQEKISWGKGSSVEVKEALSLAANELGFERASLIAHSESSELAFVIAATDDPDSLEFALSIADYPEIRSAVMDRLPLVIDDVRAHAMTGHFSDELLERQVRSLAVFPVHWKGKAMGVLRFRRSTFGRKLRDDEISFAKLVGIQLGACVSDFVVFEKLQEQTEEVSRQDYEAERRLRSIESLKEHFEASSDGVFVVGSKGQLFYANHTAVTILGMSKRELESQSLLELAAEDKRELILDSIAHHIKGEGVDAFDLKLLTAKGETIVVSVTASTVFAEIGAVVFLFRNVTLERQLELELSQTKDFLENLIESAVDAIIAADTDGTIILFNRGAERIYGFRAEDVVHKRHVASLYPEGVAKQVMQALRSSSKGGVGRLEQTRREVLAHDGELVPVNMTAALVYEGDREVASVGIFSDLRDRVRIEERLLEAQERIEKQERMSMVASLAGAAAHELNQPLTSISIALELMRSKNRLGDVRGSRYLSMIESETEKMTGIVRKIGRITRFETVEYVDGESIVDLDRSASSSVSIPAQKKTSFTQSEKDD